MTDSESSSAPGGEPALPGLSPEPQVAGQSELSRRQFLKAAGAVGAGLALGGAAARAQGPTPAVPSAASGAGINPQGTGGESGQGSGGSAMSGGSGSGGDMPPSGDMDNAPSQLSRKNTLALGRPGAGPGAPAAVVDGPVSGDGEIPMRPLGKTGMTASIIGLGGHHLGDADSVNEAMNIVHSAIDYGITFFDNCWEYHNGKSEQWLGRALMEGRRDKVVLMSKVCTHGRTKDLAMKMLEESLRRLQTDHLDVWQVHAITYDNDPDLAYAKNGVLEALTLAKQQGKARAVGFTGHKDPGLHLRMIELGYPFDTCQFPLNPLDYGFFSFERMVLPVLNDKGIAPLGMKPMCGAGQPIKDGVATAEEMLRYAMSAPVAVTITGIDSMDVLNQNLRIARGFTPMTGGEVDMLRKTVAAAAADGRYEPYKVTLQYDNPITRAPHGFPTDPKNKETIDELTTGIAVPGEIIPYAGTNI